MDVARRIQTNLLPRNPSIKGLDLACYMKPAEEVGGDYYDIYTIGNRVWILLGDVTGHGLSSGLVMLMAQSIIRSILHTQPDISPSALNVLANKVLYDNLQRLREDRQMTIVSICMTDKRHFVLSGCHDNVYIYRNATREVETINVSQMPCGLGFVSDLEDFDVAEESYTLEDNDLLLLITDGVTEAANQGDYSKGVFDEKRLISFIKDTADQPVEQIRTKLTNKLQEFTGGIFHDDVTFLIARLNP
jgi:serine phosphatase RsbU (regulator of sigma subunit)